MLSASHQSHSLDSALGSEGSGGRRARALFPSDVSPVHPSLCRPLEAAHALEEDSLSDLTLVGEADIDSPSLDYVTPSSLQCKRHSRPQQQQQDSRPSSGTFPV